MSIRSQLQRAVRRSKLPVSALSRSTGINYSTLNRWLRDASTAARPAPTLSEPQIDALAAAVGVSIRIMPRSQKTTGSPKPDRTGQTERRENDTPSRGPTHTTPQSDRHQCGE